MKKIGKTITRYYNIWKRVRYEDFASIRLTFNHIFSFVIREIYFTLSNRLVRR